MTRAVLSRRAAGEDDAAPVRAHPQSLDRSLSGSIHARDDHFTFVPDATDGDLALGIDPRVPMELGVVRDDERVLGTSFPLARDFDVGSKVYTQLLTAPQLREQLGLK